MHILERIECCSSDLERQCAFRDLGNLISRSPSALNAYIGHQQIHAMLGATLSGSSASSVRSPRPDPSFSPKLGGCL